MNRIQELIQSRLVHDRLIFSSTRRRLPSVTVRGDQMAEELSGVCLRSRNLTVRAVRSSPALIWIVEHDRELATRYRTLTPQIMDVINPPEGDRAAQIGDRYQQFDFLLVNSKSTVNYLGAPPDGGWQSWVIPHHHCNTSGFRVSDARLEKPLTVGYVGQGVHLHDAEEIEKAVRSLGLAWIAGDDWGLETYKHIDIGVAWTRRDQQRDDTRSNVKLANFVAHGIPSVVCDYESYREFDASLGGHTSLIRSELKDFIQGIEELARSEDLRRKIASRAEPAQEAYSRAAVGSQYLKMVEEVRAKFSPVN